MQFKKLLFFIISIMVLLSGCGSKTEDNKTAEAEKKVFVKPEPKFKLTTADSTELNLEIRDMNLSVQEIKGKAILINFFGTWCPPCEAEIPHLINLKNKYKDNFEVIAVSVGDRNGKVVDSTEMKSFIEEYKINYIITNSEENFKVADEMGGVRTIPTMFLFDPNGKLVQKYVGIVPEEMMETDIKKALGL